MKAKKIRKCPIVLLPLVMMAAMPALAQTRYYYVAAEDGIWDFAPSGKNLVHCPDAAPCDIPKPWTNSHSFPVTRFIQYQDASFEQRVEQPEWLGILGPVIRAEVGDTVNVHFCNNAQGAYGMHPHGFRYTKDNEGAHFFGANSGSSPGARRVELQGLVVSLPYRRTRRD